MKYSELCPCCNCKITAYTHLLNKKLVSALGKLIKFYEQEKKPAKLQADLHLDTNDNNNFQKIQYFGLVERTKGGYVPTDYGMSFYYGKAPVYEKVATFGKQVIDFRHKARQTEKSLPRRLMIWEIDEEYYKQKTEYQLEKGISQNSLFA